LEWSVMLRELAEGMLTSVEIFTLTLLFSLPLGLLVAFGRMSKNFLLRNIIKIYISIMRGTPLMLQLMVVYFGPYYIFGIRLPQSYRFTAVIISFVINYAAYFAEILSRRDRIHSAGAVRSGQSPGYSNAQTFVRIILPQVIKRILPPVTNRSNYPDQGHFPGFCDRRLRNVYPGQGHRLGPEIGGPLRCRRNFLLYL